MTGALREAATGKLPACAAIVREGNRQPKPQVSKIETWGTLRISMLPEEALQYSRKKPAFAEFRIRLAFWSAAFISCFIWKC